MKQKKPTIGAVVRRSKAIAKNLESPTILRRAQLERKIGMSRSAIYARLNPKTPAYDPTFPRPIELGSGKNPPVRLSHSAQHHRHSPGLSRCLPWRGGAMKSSYTLGTGFDQSAPILLTIHPDRLTLDQFDADTPRLVARLTQEIATVCACPPDRPSDQAGIQEKSHRVAHCPESHCLRHSPGSCPTENRHNLLRYATFTPVVTGHFRSC